MNILVVYSNNESCVVLGCKSLSEAVESALETAGDETLIVKETCELTQKELAAALYISRYEVRCGASAFEI